ncbi:hypothetical protein quinque_007091 [Culex quinquefasciatus]
MSNAFQLENFYERHRKRQVGRICPPAWFSGSTSVQRRGQDQNLSFNWSAGNLTTGKKLCSFASDLN